jgi:uncharacterized membrane protein
MIANICLAKRMQIPKGLLYERIHGALSLLKLRTIFVIQKMNKSVISIQNRHRLIHRKWFQKGECLTI